MMYRTFFVILFLFIVVYADPSPDWNYDEYGPDVWSEKYPACGGQLQSPINILTACTTYKQFEPFLFTSGYNQKHNFTLKNNGHTIMGTFNNETKLSAFTLTGGNLNDLFEFQNFHLHWGENHKSGSEHEVNGMSHEGEIHFVYQNPVTQQRAVLGMFMQSSSIDNATQNNTARLYDETHTEWQRFFDRAQTLQDENNSIVLDLNLASLMGENLIDFWRYQGSLTTPPCTEGVIWTIFKEEIIFFESEFNSFRQKVYFEDYRRPQPLFTRTIYRSFPYEKLSPIPDYNCCPKNGQNKLLGPFTSAFRELYCSTYFIFLVILRSFLMF